MRWTTLALVIPRPHHGLVESAWSTTTALPAAVKPVSCPIEKRPWWKSVDSYHLVWSPGVPQKTVASAIGWSALLVWMGKASPGGWWNYGALPLLASSCCLLQLVLNFVVAGGCVGFNTWLGPVRPLFLGLLVAQTLRPPRRVLPWALALLPEGLHLWNSRLTKVKATNMPIGNKRARVQLDIDSMGCVACINAIQNAVADFTISATAELRPLGAKGGTAELEFAYNDGDYETKLKECVQAIHDAGFGDATVASVKEL